MIWVVSERPLWLVVQREDKRWFGPTTEEALRWSPVKYGGNLSQNGHKGEGNKWVD